ncbi:tetratricopeptide repeat-containing glycosyltransferase family 2 protein [Paraclostridium dentum]|uniref:tetratricopeptide repeat-containing glycosyltransferase family 2 protein n=1 Tax=Paraclostridium dentum TaxID=2662455 RepID=UPI003F3EB331
MITISLCMIVKNEEDVIGRCLESIKYLVDEIIVVDTGSTDKTKEIVSKYTNNVYDFEWIDDFSAARNYAFSKATKKYVMWMDADDIMMPNDKTKFKKLKQNLDQSVDTIMMKYNVGFDEKDNVTLSYYRERLFKRENNPTWVDPIHEVVIPFGNIIHSDIAISHKKIHTNEPGRNLRIFEKLINSGKELNPRQQFYYSRELMYNLKYQEAIEGFTKFLDSKEGWVENCVSACVDLASTYETVGDVDNALSALYRSFSFDEPRAEVCCHIGRHLLNKGLYNGAIFWYNTALTRYANTEAGGFVNHDYYGYVPAIQLCVCYDRLGNRDMAIKFNDLAAKYKPNDPAIEYNRNYFSQTSN